MIELSLETHVDIQHVFPFVSQLYPSMTQQECVARFDAIMAQGNYYLLLATLDNVHIGMCGLWLGTKLWCGKYLEVDNLVIDTQHRGNGISTKMLNFIIAHAKKQDCDAVALDVFQHNASANALYDKAGFEAPGYHRMLWLNEQSREIGMGLKCQETQIREA